MTLYFAKLGFDQPCIGRYSAVLNRTTTEGEVHACALTCKGQGEREMVLVMTYDMPYHHGWLMPDIP